MPTGYTAAVQSGEVTSFRKFALTCARAMGANIEMRDEESDVPIHKYKPDDFYLKRLGEARFELASLENMTLPHAEGLAVKAYEEAMASRKRALRERAEQKFRYETMLDRVRAWTPPTQDHNNFKEFMEKQLLESIDFDCGNSSYYNEPIIKKTGSQYREYLIASLREDIVRYQKHHEEEVQRTNERNAWNEQLFQSLRGIP